MCLQFIELPNEIIEKIVFKIAWYEHELYIKKLAGEIAKLIYSYVNWCIVDVDGETEENLSRKNTPPTNLYDKHFVHILK